MDRRPDRTAAPVLGTTTACLTDLIAPLRALADADAGEGEEEAADPDDPDPDPRRPARTGTAAPRHPAAD